MSVAASLLTVPSDGAVFFGAGAASADGACTTVWVTLAPQAAQVSPPSLTASQTAQRQLVLMGRRFPSFARAASRPAAGLGRRPRAPGTLSGRWPRAVPGP